jgi:transcriptional regulator with XRE-family HTH domain
MEATNLLSKATQEALVGRLGKLRIERQARGLTLDEIARLSGIDRSEWSRTEGGSRPMTESKAQALAPIFGVPAEEIWSWVGGRQGHAQAGGGKDAA